MADNLPIDCWKVIFDKLGDDCQFDVISLVSKKFLVISSSFVDSFTIDDENFLSQINLSDFLGRFNQIKSIEISCLLSEQELNTVLVAIAKSELDIEELKLFEQDRIGVDGLQEVGRNMPNLTRLTCCRGGLDDMDLAAIATSMPKLEELDISCPFLDNVTDEGIKFLSSKLQDLQLLDVFGNLELTQKSLSAISSNCHKLKIFRVGGRDLDSEKGLTVDDIGVILRGCHYLTTLHMEELHPRKKAIVSSDDQLTMEDALHHATWLDEIRMDETVVSENLLAAMGKARLPLKILNIAVDKEFTFAGIEDLFKGCREIRSLWIGNSNVLSTRILMRFSSLLKNMTKLVLWKCSSVNNSSFFVITGNCPSLIFLRITAASLGEGAAIKYSNVAANFRLETLILKSNTKLNDASIISFAQVCPQIHLLNLSACREITQSGIEEIFKLCVKIHSFSIKLYPRPLLLPSISTLQQLELENLNVASSTHLTDSGIVSIAERCAGIRKLKLANCFELTDEGVMELVARCNSLEEICLLGCKNLTNGILPWMKSRKPSLKIVPPRYMDQPEKEERRKLMLKEG